MSNKARKIAFFTLTRKIQIDTVTESRPLFEINDLITFINNLEEQERKYDLKKDKKMCALVSATMEETDKQHIIIAGIFKSAESKYRPPLLDIKTDTERDNPKTLTEGEKEMTHFAIKVKDDEVYFVLEINGKGIAISNIISYFNTFKEKHLEFLNKNLEANSKIQNFKIHYTKIGKDNFLEELGKLSRARVVTVTFDKSLLGSDGLKFSNRTNTLKRDVVLTLKAEKMQSAIEFAMDMFNVFNKQNTQNSVSKIRIDGKDENNVNTILDTSFMEKIESVNVPININTGEVQTLDMLKFLKSYLINL
jgi:hypothetical protein